MKPETKRLIITLINVAIFIGNAVISYLNGGSNISGIAGVTSGTLAVTSALVS